MRSVRLPVTNVNTLLPTSACPMKMNTFLSKAKNGVGRWFITWRRYQQRCHVHGFTAFCAVPLLLTARACFSSQHPVGWQKRRLLSTDVNVHTVNEVAEYLKQPRDDGSVKHVVVMAGAGISTPSGIPDFRSPGTGLYANLEKFNLPYPEAVFDIDYFSYNPEPFYTLSKELYPSGQYRPNTAHYFVSLLHKKGYLQRMYTQNVDGLERLAGVPADRLIEAHGTYYTATCRVCYKSYSLAEIEGVVKPDIVFFGEQLPASFYKFTFDMPQADLLIVMGTSLEVQPFAGIAEAVLPGVPRILFNMEAAGPFLNSPRRNDVTSLGDLTLTVREFCELLGWWEELEQLMSDNEAPSH